MSTNAFGATACARRSGKRHRRFRRCRTVAVVHVDGVDQRVGRPDFGGDPVDAGRARGGVDRAGRLAADGVRQFRQPLLARVDPGHGVPGGC